MTRKPTDDIGRGRTTEDARMRDLVIAILDTDAPDEDVVRRLRSAAKHLQGVAALLALASAGDARWRIR